MDQNLIIDYLKKNFSFVTQPELDLMLAQSTIEKIKAGECLMQEGKENSNIFIVLYGHFAVLTHAGEEKHFLGEVGKSNIVGELSILTNQLCAASIFAKRNSVVLKVPGHVFEQIFLGNKTFRQNLIKRIYDYKENSVLEKHAQLKRWAVITLCNRDLLEDFFNKINDKNTMVSINRIKMKNYQAMTNDNNFTCSLPLALDEQYDCLMLETDLSNVAWSNLCINEADRILIIAEPNIGSDKTALLVKLLEQHKNNLILFDMVYLYPQYEGGVNKHAFFTHEKIHRYHHLRLNLSKDIDRLIRYFLNKSNGLVLSGGGARGMLHVGVIAALYEAKIPIDIAGGTSVGGMLSAGVAMDLSKETLYEYADIMAKSGIFSDYTFPSVSLLRGRRLEKLLGRFYSDMLIESLWLPFFCVSFNLSIGDMVIHRSGLLAKWIKASCAVPALFPPVIDKENIYVDGVLKDNLPIDVMCNLNAGPVIAVDVSDEHLINKNEKQGITQIIGASLLSNAKYQLERTKQFASHYLRPPSASFDVFDLKAYKKMIETGYQYTLEMIEEWDKQNILPK